MPITRCKLAEEPMLAAVAILAPGRMLAPGQTPASVSIKEAKEAVEDAREHVATTIEVL